MSSAYVDMEGFSQVSATANMDIPRLAIISAISPALPRRLQTFKNPTANKSGALVAGFGFLISLIPGISWISWIFWIVSHFHSKVMPLQN